MKQNQSWLYRLAIASTVSSTLILTACGQKSNNQSIQVPASVPNNNNQSLQVPASVQRAFAAKYPGVTPSWTAQPYGYEAVFSKNGIEYEGEFSRDGRWLETEYEVSENEFYPLVIQRIKREYPGYKVTKREIELTPQGTFYEVEIERGSKQIERYFNQRAQPVPNLNEDA